MDNDQVETAAKNGRVQALVFANTEIFPRPISRNRLRELGSAHGTHVIPQQPLHIPRGLFAAIYQEGKGLQ